MVLIETAENRLVCLTKVLEILADCIFADGHRVARYNGNVKPEAIQADFRALCNRIEDQRQVHGYGYIRLETWYTPPEGLRG